MTNRMTRREWKRGPVADPWFDDLVILGDLVISLLDQSTSSMWSERCAPGSLQHAATSGSLLQCAHASAHARQVISESQSQLCLFSNLFMSLIPGILIM